MGNEVAKPVAVGPSEQELQKVKANISRMDGAIRRKLRSGVQYNMKVIIRGARRTGKTCLWRRLQGMSFDPEYKPTGEIQSCTINWSFKNTEEAVKVEVWDVVDKGFKGTKNMDIDSGDEMDRPSDLGSSPGLLDASMVDVYQGAQACLFIVDPFQRHSFEYVEKKLSEIPQSLCCLVIINFRDVPDTPQQTETSAETPDADDESAYHRVVSPEEVEELWKRYSSSKTGPKYINFFEASMLNCYGLKLLYQYLSVPFLHLKQKSLEEQLTQTKSDIQNVITELHASISGNQYDAFIQKVKANRPEVAEGKQVLVPPQEKLSAAKIEKEGDSDEEPDAEESVSRVRESRSSSQVDEMVLKTSLKMAPQVPEQIDVEKHKSDTEDESEDTAYAQTEAQKEEHDRQKKKQTEKLRKEEKKKKKKADKDMEKRRRAAEAAAGPLVENPTEPIKDPFDFKLSATKTTAILDSFFSESEDDSRPPSPVSKKTGKKTTKPTKPPPRPENFSSDSDGELAGYSFGLKAVSNTKDTSKSSSKSKDEEKKDKSKSKLKSKDKDRDKDKEKEKEKSKEKDKKHVSKQKDLPQSEQSKSQPVKEKEHISTKPTVEKSVPLQQDEDKTTGKTDSTSIPSQERGTVNAKDKTTEETENIPNPTQEKDTDNTEGALNASQTDKEVSSSKIQLNGEVEAEVVSDHKDKHDEDASVEAKTTQPTDNLGKDVGSLQNENPAAQKTLEVFETSSNEQEAELEEQSAENAKEANSEELSKTACGTETSVSKVAFIAKDTEVETTVNNVVETEIAEQYSQQDSPLTAQTQEMEATEPINNEDPEKSDEQKLEDSSDKETLEMEKVKASPTSDSNAAEDLPTSVDVSIPQENDIERADRNHSEADEVVDGSQQNSEIQPGRDLPIQTENNKDTEGPDPCIVEPSAAEEETIVSVEISEIEEMEMTREVLDQNNETGSNTDAAVEEFPVENCGDAPTEKSTAIKNNEHTEKSVQDERTGICEEEPGNVADNEGEELVDQNDPIKRVALEDSDNQSFHSNNKDEESDLHENQSRSQSCSVEVATHLNSDDENNEPKITNTASEEVSGVSDKECGEESTLEAGHTSLSDSEKEGDNESKEHDLDTSNEEEKQAVEQPEPTKTTFDKKPSFQVEPSKSATMSDAAKAAIAAAMAAMANIEDEEPYSSHSKKAKTKKKKKEKRGSASSLEIDDPGDDESKGKKKKKKKDKKKDF